jgi:diaminopimelate decarboxylase
MHYFEYKNGSMHAEEVPVADLAREYGTPLYVYSASTLRRHFKAFDSAFNGLEHLTCFSVKANSNISVLRMMAELGGGMDIVSGGELFRALKAGVPGNKIVYSGVGKKDHEIREALAADILMLTWSPCRNCRASMILPLIWAAWRASASALIRMLIPKRIPTSPPV